MANTIIQLKKSGTPSAQPADLANGELAINYADGKLFYKDSTGTIKTVSVDAYSTVNVGGILLVADIPNDIISIGAGDNITLTPDIITDSFTIAANLKPAFDKANSANVLAKAAYDFANTLGSSSGNSFSTINVASQSNVVATSSNDVIKLQSGSGINITTNSSTKSVEFSVMPGTYSGDYGLITEAITGTNDYGSI